MPSASFQPVRYSPSLEKPEADEAETAAELNKTLLEISETTWKDEHHGLRSVHAKSHGLLTGRMTVLPNLPPELAQGVFARTGSFPVLMRLSTNPGDLLDDSVSVPRGLALKIVGVEGERLPGSEGHTTQDFVMVNGPAFSVGTGKAFLANLKMLAATTDKPQILKKAASLALRGLEAVVEAAGSESATLKQLGGHPATHPLGETFFTQVPIRYGDYVAKLSVAPVSPELTALTDKPIALSGRPNALREEINGFFAEHGGEWEVCVQLCTDLETMPIEDASVVWPEDQSPFRPVARIVVEPQPAWNEDRARKVDDGRAFSPWHGITAHQPLGSIMRLRKSAYEMSAAFRASHNHCPIHEPRSADDLP